MSAMQTPQPRPHHPLWRSACLPRPSPGREEQLGSRWSGGSLCTWGQGLSAFLPCHQPLTFPQAFLGVEITSWRMTVPGCLPGSPQPEGPPVRTDPRTSGTGWIWSFLQRECPGWVICKWQCLGVSMPSRHGVSGVRVACPRAPLFCSCGSSSDIPQTNRRKWNANPGTWGTHGNVQMQAVRQCEVWVSFWTVPRGVRQSTGL